MGIRTEILIYRLARVRLGSIVLFVLGWVALGVVALVDLVLSIGSLHPGGTPDPKAHVSMGLVALWLITLGPLVLVPGAWAMSRLYRHRDQRRAAAR